MLAMSLSSRAGDGDAKATWPRHDIDSHAGNGAAELCW
jgi:hypothetical protein